ncbi:MAG: SurA N-terminal domain-containing protein [Candidatus Omnitrophota bacterium]
MLKFLRRHHKMIMWVVAVSVIATFVLWGTVVRQGDTGPNYAGKLFGKKISIQEFSHYFDEVRIIALLRYGDMFPKILPQLNLYAQTWERILLVKEAKKLGLKVSNKELVTAIAGIPLFQHKGKFNDDLYERLVQTAFRAKARDFEESIRDTLLMAKVQEKIISEVNLTDDMVKEEYKKAHEKGRASYILIDPKEFKDQIQPSGDMLKAYYSAHKDDFRKPDQVCIEYIGLDFSKDTESSAKKTIEDISYEAVETSNLEELSKKYNASYGKTDFFAQNEPIAQLGYRPEITFAAFMLDENEISDIIKTQKGYYVIRLIAKKPSYIPGYEEIEDTVRRAYVDSKANELAKQKASAVMAQMQEKLSHGENFASAAGLVSAEGGYASGVMKTGLFSRGEYIKGLGESTEFVDALFSIKQNQIAGPAKTAKGYAIVTMDEYVPMDEEAFEKDKEEFRKQITQAKQLEYFNNWFLDLKRRADLVSYIKKQ